MGEEAAAGCYEPGPAFEEVKHEAMLDMSPTDSKEFWLVQWIKDKDFDVSKFHGKELSLKLHKDGNLGSLESYSGKSYDLVSFAYQQPNATVFLPSGSETKTVGKISRRVCLFRHKEHEELERPSFGSLTPNNNNQQQQQPSLLVPSKLSLTPSSKKSSEVPLNHKGLLHMHSQERGIEQPLYCTTQKGPLHEPLLKSKVVIDGLSFESPEEYHTLKATEIPAAEQALTSISQVPSICYRKILQEFAQKEHYPLPCYSTRKAKINDCVAFISTVKIGGEIFVGKPRGEKKKAKMNAAKVACQHFEEKVLLNHKGLLHMYSQERGIEQPLYCTTQKDPLHEPLLKSKVVIDGLSFESPEEYHTLKVTEIAAAEQALTSISEVPSICYRKILQEFAQKEHYPLPCYSTRKAKINDCVAFISTVEIGGQIFVGKPRGEKKKAKMNAAKVACQHFEEKRKGSDSSAPVLGGSDMQNATSMQSAGQVIHSGELGHSVPKISTVTCYKTNDSDADSSWKALTKKESSQLKQNLLPGRHSQLKKEMIRQGSAPSVCAMSMEQIPEHKMTIDESDVGHLDVSGRASEGLRTQSNMATEMPQTTPEKLPEMKKDESAVGHLDVLGKASEEPTHRCRDAQSNTATEMPQVTPEKPPQKKVKMAEQ